MTGSATSLLRVRTHLQDYITRYRHATGPRDFEFDCQIDHGSHFVKYLVSHQTQPKSEIELYYESISPQCLFQIWSRHHIGYQFGKSKERPN